MDVKFIKFNPKSKRDQETEFTVMPFLNHRKKLVRQILAFTFCGLLVVSILQGGLYLSSARKASGEILGAATTAYGDLNNATKNLSQQNLSSAADLYKSASANIQIAQSKLNNFKPITWIHPQANSADHILEGAGYLAQAGGKLTNALDFFAEFKVSSKGVETEAFTDKLSTNVKALTETKILVDKSAVAFSKVSAVPLDYEDALNKAKVEVEQLSLVLDKLIGLEKLYLNILGKQKTYFLIFQNYDEQRATGGFIGTYGVIRTNQGAITKLKIDSIYDLDGQIYELIAAPGPFQPDIKRWGIRDANWFADFPTSAKKLLYFFEKGGETADGVISVTPSLFGQLLKITGPIEMPEYGVTLTADNFQEVVQYKTSVDYDRKENEPKKMLADFAPILLDRLSNLPQDQWFNFFQIMQDNLNQRQIMVYSADPESQKIIDELGFSGKILPTDYDYLSIVNSNMGGTKTDLDINQTINLKNKILSDGSIMNTLEVTRKNTAVVHNKDYMRILVPLGSELISASGFDEHAIYSSASEGLRIDPELAEWDKGQMVSDIFVRTEAGKTEFAGWLDVDGDTEKTVTITYMLPFKINSVYSLLFQKQAGSIPINFTNELILGNKTLQWVSSNASSSVNSLNYRSHSNVDDFWGAILK